MRLFYRLLIVAASLLIFRGDLRAQEGNFLPDDLAPITADNAAQLTEVAQIGRGWVSDLTWSADGESVLVSSTTGLWRYGLDSTILPESPLLPPENGSPRTLISPRGTYIAYISTDSVIVRDQNGLELNLNAGAGYVKAAFSLDNQLLASVDYEGQAIIWELPSGDERTSFPTDGGTGVVGISPDARWLVTTESKQTDNYKNYEVINLWDIESGQKGLSFKNLDQQIVSGIAFTSDGKQMAVAAIGAVYLWDVQTGDQLGKFETESLSQRNGGSPYFVNGEVVFSPDDQQIAAIGVDLSPEANMAGKVHVWNLKTGETEAVFEGLHGFASNLAYSPDGAVLAAYSYDGAVRILNPQMQMAQILVDTHAAASDRLALSPDGLTLAAGGFERSVRLWSLETGTLMDDFYLHSSDVVSLVYSVDGALASSSIFATFLLTTEGLHQVNIVAAAPLTLAFSPDGTQLMGAAKSGIGLYLWKTAVDNQDHVQADQPDIGTIEITAAAYNPQGDILAVGELEGGIRLLNANTLMFEDISTLFAAQTVSVLVFSPDGKWLAAGYEDGGIYLWNIETGEQRSGFAGHEGKIYGLNFNSDGTLLASAGEDMTARIWDVETGDNLAVLNGHTAEVTSVVFTSDSRLLISGGYDSIVRIWGIPSQN